MADHLNTFDFAVSHNLGLVLRFYTIQFNWWLVQHAYCALSVGSQGQALLSIVVLTYA